MLETSTPKKISSRDRFIAGALAFVDEFGFEALTMRSLGEYMGVHATAVYRHFASKDDLLEGISDVVFGKMLAQLNPDLSSPRERMFDIMQVVRAVIKEHPNFGLPLMFSPGLGEQGGRLTYQAISLVEEMGLSGHNLAVGYQMLESAVLGSNVFDHAAAPDHLSQRQQRRLLLEHPAMTAEVQELSGVEAVNDEAYILMCNALLDALEAMAK